MKYYNDFEIYNNIDEIVLDGSVYTVKGKTVNTINDEDLDLSDLQYIKSILTEFDPEIKLVYDEKEKYYLIVFDKDTERDINYVRNIDIMVKYALKKRQVEFV